MAKFRLASQVTSKLHHFDIYSLDRIPFPFSSRQHATVTLTAVGQCPRGTAFLSQCPGWVGISAGKASLEVLPGPTVVAKPVAPHHTTPELHRPCFRFSCF